MFQKLLARVDVLKDKADLSSLLITTSHQWDHVFMLHLILKVFEVDFTSANKSIPSNISSIKNLNYQIILSMDNIKSYNLIPYWILVESYLLSLTFLTFNTHHYIGSYSPSHFLKFQFSCLYHFHCQYTPLH
jgi:hypothetical protein